METPLGARAPQKKVGLSACALIYNARSRASDGRIMPALSSPVTYRLNPPWLWWAKPPEGRRVLGGPSRYQVLLQAEISLDSAIDEHRAMIMQESIAFVSSARTTPRS